MPKGFPKKMNFHIYETINTLSYKYIGPEGPEYCTPLPDPPLIPTMQDPWLHHPAAGRAQVRAGQDPASWNDSCMKSLHTPAACPLHVKMSIF